MNKICFISPDKRYAYINIHKNGSTFIRNIIEPLNFKVIDFNALPNITTLILVLREDIIMRWVSGVTTYLFLNTKTIHDISNIPAKIDYCLKHIVVDEHTRLQSSFQENTEKFNKIFFKLDIDFSNIFINFLQDNGYKINDIATYKNSTKQKSNDEKIIYEQIKKYVLMPEYNHKLVKFFYDDYMLVENTTFYTG